MADRSPDVYVRTTVLMDTFVTIQVVGHGADEAARGREETVDRAFDWFRQVEACCTRFDPQSEVRQLCATVGAPVPATPMLFEAVRFAIAVAADSQGAFDPTVGHRMEARGFTRNYQTGDRVRSTLDPDARANFRDVVLDDDRHTITLRRPLLLDLGAVAKGLAIDMAARELEPFADYVVDAGGDLYLGGRNPNSQPWTVGIRHPRRADEMIESVSVSNMAVCTSGDYERTATGPHIIDPRTAETSHTLASVTVIAPTAMAADALGTAAFVLGPRDGLELFARHGVDGLLITTDLRRFSTGGWKSHAHGV